MYWYAIYRYPERDALPSTGIFGPYTSEEGAYLKLAEVEEASPEISAWEVYGSYTDNPKKALTDFLGEKMFGYAGGRKLNLGDPRW